MKGYAAAAAAPVKRRCRGFAVLVVITLVLCSLFFPIALLLGRFPSGYVTDERLSRGSSYSRYGITDNREQGLWEVNQTRLNELVKRLTSNSHQVPSTTPKAVNPDNIKKADGGKAASSAPIGVHGHVSKPKDPASHPKPNDSTSHSKGPPPKQIVSQKIHPPLIERDGSKGVEDKLAKGSSGDEIKRSCQLEFGSYCLWSIEHKEVLKDSTVKRLKDQLFVARAYYPSIAKLQGKEKLTFELKQHIQEHERMLGEVISDADLPPINESKILRMDQIIARAKSCAVECSNVDKKFRQLLDLTEDEAHFHMKQSAFLFQLGAQTMPKSLHCLSMRLSVEFFKVASADMDQSSSQKIHSSSLRHYVIFSKNILAASVTINSTVMNSEETGNIVFHLLTDGQNYYAMKLWFYRNSYKTATIFVRNIEEISPKWVDDINVPQLSPSEEFRVSFRGPLPTVHMKTEYLSVFGHSHFLLPEIFKNLERVVVLEDDVVVQRDLSTLWDLDLLGKVNGAVEFCGVRLGQLKPYLGGFSHDARACSWMSGVNIVDLKNWRKHNITGKYQQLLHKLQDGSEASWRAAALPISLLAFQDLVYRLDDSWVLSGLGHDYGVDEGLMKKAATLHYDGNMKPWLDLGIPRYKKHWKRFLTQEERFMDQCNINP